MTAGVGAALLRSFPKVEFAATYGSAVKAQAGYTNNTDKLLDLLLAVDNPVEWHRENIARNPSHYSSLRWLGAKTVAAVQTGSGGRVYFNTDVSVDGVRLKYGVIATADLVADCQEWYALYVAGRLHKPVCVLASSSAVASAMQANYRSAVATALCLLPTTFDERALITTITRLSYTGDSRMALAENPDKVKNIVEGQESEMKELYSSVMNELRIRGALETVEPPLVVPGPSPSGGPSRQAHLSTNGGSGYFARDSSGSCAGTGERRNSGCSNSDSSSGSSSGKCSNNGGSSSAQASLCPSNELLSGESSATLHSSNSGGGGSGSGGGGGVSGGGRKDGVGATASVTATAAVGGSGAAAPGLTYRVNEAVLSPGVLLLSLPACLQAAVVARLKQSGGDYSHSDVPTSGNREFASSNEVSSDDRGGGNVSRDELRDAVELGLSSIVRRSSLVQTLKGLFTAGLTVSLQYGARKVRKRFASG